MIEITIKGHKRVDSKTTGGLVEKVLYTTSVIYPNIMTMSEDDVAKRREALFYIRNFLLLDSLGDEALDPYFRNIRTAQIVDIKPLNKTEVKKAVADGKLFNLDPYGLTAAKVDKMSSTQIFHAIMLMQEDVTMNVSGNLLTLKEGGVDEKRVFLKNLLGLKDEIVNPLAKKRNMLAEMLEEDDEVVETSTPVKSSTKEVKSDLSGAKEIS